MRLVRAAKVGYIAASIANILIGLLLVLSPESSGLIICRVIGAIIFISGAVKLFGYFTNDLYRLAFQFDLALGLLTMILGALIISKPELFSQFMVIVAAGYVILNALFTLQTAIEARGFGLRKWWLLLVAALISGLLGTLLLIDPFDGAVTITVLIGGAFLFDGIQNLLVAMITIHYRKES